MKNQSETKRGSALVLLAALCWSTMGSLTRVLNAAGIFSREVTQVRVTVAFLTIGIFLLCNDRTLLRVRWKDLWCFLGTGLCSLLMYCICYFKALETTDISVVTVLAYMSPVYLMLLGTVLFREKLTGRKLLALALSVSGCVLVSGVLGGFHGDSTGILLALAAGFFYALYSVFTKYAIVRGYQTWTILLYTFGFAALGSSFLCDWPSLTGVLVQRPVLSLLCIAFGEITCCIPYALYSRGLQKLELSRASILNCVDVVFSSVFGAVFFREYPGWTALLGIALVLTAVILLSLSETKKRT